MGIYALDSFFRPRSVAVAGASPRPRSLGRVVLQQLREGGFDGRIGLVNPHHAQIDGVPAAASLAQLDFVPELLLVAVPPGAVPAVAQAAAERGTRALGVLTQGLGHGPDSPAGHLRRIAHAHGLRVLGPNCLGVLSPHHKLYASFAVHRPGPGDLALISQSGTVAASLIEWTRGRSIGFSGAVSLGDAVDVDFADLLDYFATERHTRSILLYIERIDDARKFLSAARAAARTKPVVVVKPGRCGHPPLADSLHAALLRQPDAVYDAAFRRAGVLRVHTLDESFAAAETLSYMQKLPGRRLALMANGAGVGLLAADRVQALGGLLAALSPSTIQTLERRLYRGWSRANPVDMLGDADGERYAQTLQALLEDEENDAILALHTPTALSDGDTAADAVCTVLKAQRRRRKPVLGVWLGQSAAAQERLNRVGVPTYATEADAVRGFTYLADWQDAQRALMETPPSLPDDFSVDAAAAQAVVATAIAAGRDWLDPLECDALFAAYGIALAPVALAGDADAAVRAAQPWLWRGQQVVLKVCSPDIRYKSAVDGVRLGLADAGAVRAAAEDILQRVARLRPQARVQGLSVHPMIERPQARELVAGIADDPVFGPVIAFGSGGTAADIIQDAALALPPLDLRLAHDLIGRTWVSGVLRAYRDMPAADERALALALVKLAQLAADVPQIHEVELNPLLAGPEGVLALDARVMVGPARVLHKGRGHPRFAIFPYPKQWERRITLSHGGQALVRPVRPEDEAMFRAFFEKVSSEDLRLRFFSAVRDFSHEFIARLTQLDYARSIALAAVDPASGQMLGAVRLLADANYDRGEYGIMVRSDLKGAGLGWRLMQIMIEYARWLGLNLVEGQVLRENTTMLAMCRRLGFDIRYDQDDPSVAIVEFPLDRAPAQE